MSAYSSSGHSTPSRLSTFFWLASITCTGLHFAHSNFKLYHGHQKAQENKKHFQEYKMDIAEARSLKVAYTDALTLSLDTHYNALKTLQILTLESLDLHKNTPGSEDNTRHTHLIGLETQIALALSHFSEIRQHELKPLEDITDYLRLENRAAGLRTKRVTQHFFKNIPPPPAPDIE